MSNRARKSFTLIELLVVIAIIALLVGVLIAIKEVPPIRRIREVAADDGYAKLVDWGALLVITLVPAVGTPLVASARRRHLQKHGGPNGERNVYLQSKDDAQVPDRGVTAYNSHSKGIPITGSMIENAIPEVWSSPVRVVAGVKVVYDKRPSDEDGRLVIRIDYTRDELIKFVDEANPHRPAA